MQKLNNRPATGLDPEAALLRWSDPAKLAVVAEYADAKEDVSVATGFEPTPKVLRHRKYAEARKFIEDALHDKLLAGELFVSVLQGSLVADRDVLRPSVFSVLWISYTFNEVVGPGEEFRFPEIFERSAIPRNIDIPDWLLDEPGVEHPPQPEEDGGFEPDEDYRHVTINGVSFTLGATQARVICILHELAETTKPGWGWGKQILPAAGSSSKGMSELFKSQPGWAEHLIESDGRGQYRLRLNRDR